MLVVCAVVMKLGISWYGKRPTLHAILKPSVFTSVGMSRQF
jgi:hypothetical protein